MPVKKVLLVIDNLGSGGAQNQMTQLAVGLKKKGYEVHVFSYYPQDFYKHRLSENHIPVIYYEKRHKIGFAVVKALRDIIEASQFDVVLSYLHTPNFYAAVAKRLAKHKPNLIISYRSMTDFKTESWFSILLKKWVNRQATHIVSNAHHERKRWQSLQPSLATKWTTIYNVVGNDYFSFPCTDHRNEELLVVGTVGPDKNGLLIIEALHRLKSKGFHFVLNWIGKTLKQAKYHQYYQVMRALLSKYDLYNLWNWKPETRDIAHAYRSCGALILASEVEGLPNVVCEAMASGTICIVSDVLDHGLIIEDEVSGILFKPSVEALANAILKWKDMSSSERYDMSVQAHIRAKEFFDNKDFVSAYESLILS